MRSIVQIVGLWMVVAVLCSCNDLFDDTQREDSYEGATEILSVQLEYPDRYEEQMKGGARVSVEEVNQGAIYTSTTNPDGVAHFEVSHGLYRISARDQLPQEETVIYFNGMMDQVIVTSALSAAQRQMKVRLTASKSGQILVKEVYCGGCKKLPFEGDYQVDKYVILYNNSNKVAYLDQLCFGTVDPYNSNGNNPWLLTDPVTGSKTFRDYFPITECVWGFPGSGKGFPLDPGQQAVVAICGAIDHAAQYPLSVNLNLPDLFACYDNTYYTNTIYHPTPGDQVQSVRYMQVFRKMGISTGYSFSNTSPTVILFQVPQEAGSARAYVNDVANEVLKPGAQNVRCIKVPNDWVMDGVEIFAGSSTGNTKRLSSVIDAGYVTLSGSFQAHTLYRNVNKEATLDIPANTVVYNYAYGKDPSGIDAEATRKAGGRIIYKDTNNSSEDFHERTIQSLHVNSR